MKLVIDGAAVSTVDAAGTEHATGHVIVVDGRIQAVGGGAAPKGLDAHYVDGRECLLTPGFVNTHHHLYQWATRGYAQQAILFEWLTELYPVWGRLDADIVHAAASAGLTRLAQTGCTTAADHHYVFPSNGGDVFAALVSAGERVGIRLHAIRGSMDRGVSHGGLPPDNIVETIDGALAGTADAIGKYHDPAFDSMIRVAVGPCSPFSVSEELMRRGAELARSMNVRMHTHLAETVEEEQQCLAEFGCTPLEYAERLGWLGGDSWFAHGIHFSDSAVEKLASTRTGVTHCPSSNSRLGAGIARTADLLGAGAPVGLGVDGAASHEDGGLLQELRQAMYLARQRGGPAALSAREALRIATIGGARVLGREKEIGSIEPGKLADLALWRLDGFEHAGIADPVAALVLGPVPPLALLTVGGRPVVTDGQLTGVDEEQLAAELRVASRRLAER
ncbi:8-oxoguanine deaminase [Fodinicola acaciae]|uniref:8-oxoguanine deaminase n=1 Tax=Fodinicola acaciae TaxID=2681555 RepID=UPI0013CFDC4A|nr:8-oxoguanine deaminase [Fodinicola acaciae]